MRFLQYGACLVGLLLLLTVSVRADTPDDLYREQLEASGGSQLENALPPETRELLDRLGIDIADLSVQTPSAETWVSTLWQMLRGVAAKPLAASAAVIGVLLIYAWVDGMRHTLKTDETATVFSAICLLSASGAILLPLSQLIEQVCEAMESVSVFMYSFIPVYAAILLSGGQPTAAASFQTLVMGAAQILSYVGSSVVVPLLTVSLALGLVGTLTPELRLGRIGGLTAKGATWLLTLGMVLFTGILSLQSLTGVAADRLSDRAVRFSIAHFVPVVGGTLSEAFGTVRGCLHLLRSSVGGFGIAATLLIILPPALSCVIWNVLLSVTQTAADIFGLSTFSELLKNAQGITKALLAVLTVSGLLLIVSLAVIALAAGGAT